MKAWRIVCLVQLSLFLLLSSAGCSTSRRAQQLSGPVLQHLTNCRAMLVSAQGISNVRYTNGMLFFDPVGEPRISSATQITSDGYFLTSGHSVPGPADTANKIWILERRGDREVRETPARLVHLWPEADLALVYSKRDRADHLKWAPLERVNKGEPVWKSSGRTGNTVGQILSTVSPTNGIMVIDHSCKVRAGDSGSPLITPDGELLGINAARLYFTWTTSRVGFGGSQAVRPELHHLERLINLDRGGGQSP